MVIGWSKQALIGSVVSTASAAPEASTRPSRNRIACVVLAGSSSRWWVTSTLVSDGCAVRKESIEASSRSRAATSRPVAGSSSRSSRA